MFIVYYILYYITYFVNILPHLVCNKIFNINRYGNKKPLKEKINKTAKNSQKPLCA